MAVICLSPNSPRYVGLFHFVLLLSLSSFLVAMEDVLLSFLVVDDIVNLFQYF